MNRMFSFLLLDFISHLSLPLLCSGLVLFFFLFCIASPECASLFPPETLADTINNH